jgi:hypothetical protein
VEIKDARREKSPGHNHGSGLLVISSVNSFKSVQQVIQLLFRLGIAPSRRSGLYFYPKQENGLTRYNYLLRGTAFYE